MAKTPGDSEPDEDESAAEDSAAPPKRITRHVQPLGPRVLLRILESPARLDSGLYLPQGAKDEHADALLAEVVEVARSQPKTGANYADDDDDDDLLDLGVNVSGIPLAAKVLFGKAKGMGVPWDETLRIVDVRHILAIVDEIPEEEIQ